WRNSSVTPSVIFGPKTELFVYFGSAANAAAETARTNNIARTAVTGLPFIFPFLLPLFHEQGYGQADHHKGDAYVKLGFRLAFHARSHFFLGLHRDDEGLSLFGRSSDAQVSRRLPGLPRHVERVSQGDDFLPVLEAESPDP